MRLSEKELYLQIADIAQRISEIIINTDKESGYNKNRQHPDNIIRQCFVGLIKCGGITPKIDPENPNDCYIMVSGHKLSIALKNFYDIDSSLMKEYFPQNYVEITKKKQMKGKNKTQKWLEKTFGSDYDKLRVSNIPKPAKGSAFEALNNVNDVLPEDKASDNREIDNNIDKNEPDINRDDDMTSEANNDNPETGIVENTNSNNNDQENKNPTSNVYNDFQDGKEQVEDINDNNDDTDAVNENDNDGNTPEADVNPENTNDNEDENLADTSKEPADEHREGASTQSENTKDNNDVSDDEMSLDSDENKDDLELTDSYKNPIIPRGDLVYDIWTIAITENNKNEEITVTVLPLEDWTAVEDKFSAKIAAVVKYRDKIAVYTSTETQKPIITNFEGFNMNIRGLWKKNTFVSSVQASAENAICKPYRSEYGTNKAHNIGHFIEESNSSKLHVIPISTVNSLSNGNYSPFAMIIEKDGKYVTNSTKGESSAITLNKKHKTDDGVKNVAIAYRMKWSTDNLEVEKRGV